MSDFPFGHLFDADFFPLHPSVDVQLFIADVIIAIIVIMIIVVVVF